MTKRSRVSFFIKYLMSYLIIFLIPLFVLGIIIYNDSVKNLRNDIEKSIINNLNYARDMIDVQLKSIDMISARISKDSKLTPFFVKENKYTPEAIEKLNQYQANNMFIEDIMLYFYNEETVYFSSGTIDLDALLTRTYRFNNEEKKEFINYLNSDAPQVLSTVKKNKVSMSEAFYTYSTSIPYLSLSSYGKAVFFLHESLFTDSINSVFGNFNGNLYVISGGSIINAAINSEEAIKLDIILEMTKEHNEPKIYNKEIKNKSYSFVVSKSNNTDLYLIAIIPTNQFLSRVIQKRTLFMIVLAVILLVCFTISLTLSSLYYNPIKQTVNMANSYMPSESIINNCRNEMDFIKNSLGIAINSSKKFLEQIERQKPLVKEQLLIKLIKGEFSDSKGIYDQLNTLNIKMEGTCFYVVAVVFKNYVEEGSNKLLYNTIKTIPDRLKKSNYSINSVNCVELVESNSINSNFVFIVNTYNSSNLEMQQAYLTNDIMSFLKADNSKPVMGIGNIYSNIEQIPRSFIQAGIAIEYCMKRVNGSVVFFDEKLSSQINAHWYAYDEQLLLIQSLRQGNKKQSIELLGNIIKGISESNVPISLFKCMCYDIVNNLIKIAEETNYNGYMPFIEKLVDFPTLEDFKDNLFIFSSHICENINQCKKSNNKELRDQVINYIKMNFKNNCLSLDSLSDKFGYSASYMSRFFKEQTGTNFSNYLFQLRLDAVKKELKNSNKVIKIIIREAGYIDTSHFIRKFKKIEGITPNQYRELHSL